MCYSIFFCVRLYFLAWQPTLMWFVSCLALMIFLVTFLATLKQIKFVLFFAVGARFEFGTSISIEIDAVWVTWYYALRCCHLRGMTLCSKMLQPTWPHHTRRCGWLHDLYDRALGLIMWKWGCLHDMNMTWYLIWIHLKVWSLKLHDIIYIENASLFYGKKTGRCALDICLPGMLHGCRYWTMNIPIQVWVTQFGPRFHPTSSAPQPGAGKAFQVDMPQMKTEVIMPGNEDLVMYFRPYRRKQVPEMSSWTVVHRFGCQVSKELKKHQDMMIEFAVRMYPCLRVFNIGCFDDSCLFCFSIPVIVYWQSTSLPRDLCLRDSLKATALAWHGYWTNDGTDGSAGRSLICGETTPFWPLRPSPSLTLRRGLGFDIVGGCLLVHRSGMNATAFFFATSHWHGAGWRVLDSRELVSVATSEN